jgi:hypothetical protein
VHIRRHAVDDGNGPPHIVDRRNAEEARPRCVSDRNRWRLGTWSVATPPHVVRMSIQRFSPADCAAPRF